LRREIGGTEDDEGAVSVVVPLGLRELTDELIDLMKALLELTFEMQMLRTIADN
jgi:hypothetical protein